MQSLLQGLKADDSDAYNKTFGQSLPAFSENMDTKQNLNDKINSNLNSLKFLIDANWTPHNNSWLNEKPSINDQKFEFLIQVDRKSKLPLFAIKYPAILFSDKIYTVTFCNLVSGSTFYNFKQNVELSLDEIKNIKTWTIDKETQTFTF
jgi:hypothetical protein